jgi:uncharacterized protein (TIGR02271 family)
MPSKKRRPDVLPLAEETLRIEKRSVSRGLKTIRSVTEESEELVTSDLLREEVVIDRIPVGKEVSVAPPVRTEGEVTIIPVLEEVVHIAKRLVLVEEVHVRRVTHVEQKTVPVRLRKQRALIEENKTRLQRSRAQQQPPTSDKGNKQ